MIGVVLAAVINFTYGRVPATLVLPETTKKAPAIVFMHWGLGDRHAFLDEAKSLARLGVASLLIDAPFVRPRAKIEETDDLRRCVADVRAGVDRLVTRRDIDAKRIAFVGLSYGAHIGALLAAEEPRFRAFVLMGGLASNADAEHNPELAPLDAERFVKLPHSAPIFFQFARKDEYIDYQQASRFIEAASPPKIAKWYEGGHQFNESARRDRLSWLSTILHFPLDDANYHAVAASEAPASELGRYAELSKLGVVIDIPGMQQISVKRNVAFKRDLEMDLYYPFGLDAKDRVPAVILVSGQAGEPLMRNLRGVAFNTTLARALAARANRVAVVCDVRSTKEDTELAGVAADMDDLIAFLRLHADELQIDADSLAVWVRSAGWSYGLHAALRNSPPYIKAVVAYSARLSSELPEFSPIELLKKSPHFPPFLLVTAGHDDFYVPAEVESFLAAAKAKGAEVTHIHVADGEHGFEIFNDYEESRDALLRTFIFLHDHLPLKPAAQ